MPAGWPAQLQAQPWSTEQGHLCAALPGQPPVALCLQLTNMAVSPEAFSESKQHCSCRTLNPFGWDEQQSQY